MTRYGPLESRDGHLAIGDLGGHHVRLTEAGIVILRHGEEPIQLGWNTIASATFDVRTTRFRWPGAVTTALLAVAGAMLHDWEIVDQEYDASFDVVPHEGDAVHVDVTRHHVGRYWVKPVRATQALLRRLIDDPESRMLLRDPERLLAMLRA
ncbi:hypothetical protein [Paramicrobacterium agarici]|uniref:Uncharacterized protein n=1 Tax=Paramicrobacterium agarici TaxID=630514 RepID=A0A2A9DU37_9MICO|nr:hypothetical protein [Microbacterium agarici]PFG29430.1 hypothetical protein ATJ78_0335 [Microbacterium agarici]